MLLLFGNKLFLLLVCSPSPAAVGDSGHGFESCPLAVWLFKRKLRGGLLGELLRRHLLLPLFVLIIVVVAG